MSADIAVYTPPTAIVYTILVNNAGPDSVTGFNITDTIPVAINGLTITCTPSDPVDSCGTDNTVGQDVAFNGASLSAGQTLTITIQGVVGAGTVGDLSNTANLVIPGGAGFNDPDTSNNSDTENTLATVRPDIGLPDGGYYNPGDGNPAAFLLTMPITADGDPSPSAPDFVYFEYMSTPTTVLLDWVQLEISADGSTWYTVFFWGNGVADTNTNVNIDIISGAESDNRSFATTDLYNNSGITIDIDSITGISTGIEYWWIRITAPEYPPGSGDYGAGPGNPGDGLTLDSIQPYYP
jgi:uncharacterized repeat protein (TIGR01451 family)